MDLRTRVLVAVVSGVLLVGGAVGYAVAARDPAPAASEADVSLASEDGRLLVLSNRRITVVDPSGKRSVSDVECVRVYAAGGTGVCLRQDNPWKYSLRTLDESLHETGSAKVRGLPNRARVSASGRMVSWTTFISGESYNKGGFSTRTGILDRVSGNVVPSLEGFSVTREGRPYRAVDVNYWGVTFTADDNRFFATLSTDGHRYLVEGDLRARTIRTLADNVECPSLSPDGTRIAFKRAIDDNPVNGWRLSVLDLATMKVTPLAETRSIDDQPAWLDESTIGYTWRDAGGEPSVWGVQADGTGEPTLLVANAESPAPL